MKAVFKGSYPSMKAIPKAAYPEFAFIGRSNVGKSSLINMLTNHKGLAKTSSKPGKTQHVVQFLVDNSWYLVDLPGYGYAKVSQTQREEFGKLIQAYLKFRESLYCVFVLIDSRIDPQENDLDFIEWLGDHEVPFVIAFTKTDKLSQKKLDANIEAFKNKLLETWEELPRFFITSAEAKTGREEILEFIETTRKNSN